MIGSGQTHTSEDLGFVEVRPVSDLHHLGGRRDGDRPVVHDRGAGPELALLEVLPGHAVTVDPGVAPVHRPEVGDGELVAVRVPDAFHHAAEVVHLGGGFDRLHGHGRQARRRVHDRWERRAQVGPNPTQTDPNRDTRRGGGRRAPEDDSSEPMRVNIL